MAEFVPASFLCPNETLETVINKEASLLLPSLIPPYSYSVHSNETFNITINYGVLLKVFSSSELDVGIKYVPMSGFQEN